MELLQLCFVSTKTTCRPRANKVSAVTRRVASHLVGDEGGGVAAAVLERPPLRQRRAHRRGERICGGVQWRAPGCRGNCGAQRTRQPRRESAGSLQAQAMGPRPDHQNLMMLVQMLVRLQLL